MFRWAQNGNEENVHILNIHIKAENLPATMMAELKIVASPDLGWPIIITILHRHCRHNIQYYTRQHYCLIHHCRLLDTRTNALKYFIDGHHYKFHCRRFTNCVAPCWAECCPAPHQTGERLTTTTTRCNTYMRPLVQFIKIFVICKAVDSVESHVLSTETGNNILNVFKSSFSSPPTPPIYY